jgi:hypothetical protein
MKFLLTIIPFLGSVMSICFNTFDIKNFGLMSFENKVYNLSNYNDHPGGFNTLLLTKGKDVGSFFEMDKYKFHITSSLQQTKLDLDKIYIGQVCNPSVIIKKSVYETSLFLFPMITLTLFFINGIIVTFCEERECEIWSGRYISFKILISCIFYIIWWISLGLLSFFLGNVIRDTGIWISLCIMFGMLPMTRNSIWILFFKASYTKLTPIHKIISILTNIAVLIKLIAVIYYLELSFLFSKLKATMGTIATILIWIMSILALPIIREKCFELFYYSHKFLLICITIISGLHYILCIYLVLPSLILYFIDLIVRFIKTYKIIYTKVQTFEFQDENKTKYNFLTLVTKRNLESIEAGSFFFICNKKISKYEFHPISLVKQKQNVLLFCLKDLGHNSWSSKFEDDETNDIYIQGPYNYFEKDYKNNKYKKIILISNGIGITPMINIFEEIYNLSLSNSLSNLQKIVFIWIVPHPSFIEPFTDVFDTQHNIVKINIEIKIFVTKQLEYNDNLNNFPYSKYNVIYRKPMIESEIVNLTLSINKNQRKNVCVLCCGSTNLIGDVELACVNLNIDLYKESFV